MNSIESLKLLAEEGFFDKEQRRIVYRLEEMSYFSLLAYIVYGQGHITGAGVPVDLRSNPSLKEALLHSRLKTTDTFEYAVRGIASRAEDKLRPNRPLARKLGEERESVLKDIRQVKKVSLEAPISSHLTLSRLILPEFFDLLDKVG